MKAASLINKKSTHILLLIAAVLIVLLIIFARTDNGNPPEVTCTEGNLMVSVDATEKDILSGMIATDKEDGDITDSILIESYSDFVSEGVRSVTYAVMDSDLNVAKFTRNIEYTDYTAPVFKLNMNPVVGVGTSANILEGLKAEDVLDGDITGKIRLLSSDVDEEKAGKYTTKCAVTNSAGDISEIEIPVYISDHFAGKSPIELSEYLIYKKKKETVEFRHFITAAREFVTVKPHGNFSKEGTCYVDYLIGNTVYARLVVVVQ